MVPEKIIPLFPLGLVLQPEQSLPLYIFEERYKQMVNLSVGADTPFGVVYFDGTRMKSIGCAARVLEILRHYDDGRMDILTRGEDRFIIRQIFDRKSYLEAEVVFFDDAVEPLDDRVEESARKGLALMERLDVPIPIAESTRIADPVALRRISFLIAGWEGFSADEKQTLLEMTSTRERLEKGVRALEVILDRIALSREVRRIIDGNGNPASALRDRPTNP